MGADSSWKVKTGGWHLGEICESVEQVTSKGSFAGSKTCSLIRPGVKTTFEEVITKYLEHSEGLGGTTTVQLPATNAIGTTGGLTLRS